MSSFLSKPGMQYVSMKDIRVELWFDYEPKKTSLHVEVKKTEFRMLGHAPACLAFSLPTIIVHFALDEHLLNTENLMNNVGQQLLSGTLHRPCIYWLIKYFLHLSRCIIRLGNNRLPPTLCAPNIPISHPLAEPRYIVDLIKTRIQQGDGSVMLQRYVFFISFDL